MFAQYTEPNKVLFKVIYIGDDRSNLPFGLTLKEVYDVTEETIYLYRIKNHGFMDKKQFKKLTFKAYADLRPLR